MKPVLPTDSEARKLIPIFSGVLNYFPLAIAAVARVSKRGNDKHNPGQPLHWARGKSMDHADCIARHLIDVETPNGSGEFEDAECLAWRALAKLQELEEKRLGAEMSRGSKKEATASTAVIESTHLFPGSSTPVPAHQHPNGKGWVADTAYVEATAYVGPNARVSDKARVSGNVLVYGNAWVYGNARVSDKALVYGTARVSGDARVYGAAVVDGNAQVYGYAWVGGDAQVSGDAEVYENAEVHENAMVFGNAEVYGEDARVYGDALVYGDAMVSGNAQVYGGARVYENAEVHENAMVFGNAEVYGDARVGVGQQLSTGCHS